MNRRDFLGKASVTAGTAALSQNVFAGNNMTDNLQTSTEFSELSATPPASRKGEMIYWTPGKIGEKVSAIGKYEKFKTDTRFDGTAKNLELLRENKQAL